jgi:peptidoglycan/LPS O-acetylase OafA/YrhL
MEMDKRGCSGISYRGHLPALDTLRGVAILMVLWYHAFAYYPTGFGSFGHLFAAASRFGRYGVHLFFVLSGFLIVGKLIDARGEATFYKPFYIRRVLRIIPAYLLMLVSLKVSSAIGWRYLLACVLYVANTPQLLGLKALEYGSFWSLAVEEQFYIIMPAIVRRVSPKSLVRFMVSFCAICPVLRFLARFISPTGYYYMETWGNADYLMYGALVALLLRTQLVNTSNITLFSKRLAVFGVGTLPISLFFSLSEKFPVSTVAERLLCGALDAVGVLPCISVFLSMLLWAINAGHDKRGFAGSGVFGFFGYISYGLYLVHQGVFRLYEKVFGPTPPDLYPALVRACICISVAVGLAYLSRKFFEDRFLKIHPRRRNDKALALEKSPVSESGGADHGLIL